MKYNGPSVEQMNNKQGKGGVYSNRQDISFKLFPFTTHLAMPDVSPGTFLRRASGYTIKNEKEVPEIIEEVISIIEDDTAEDCKKQVFGALREIAGFANISNSGNFRIALSDSNMSNAEKIAWYLTSMACNADALRVAARSLIESTDKNANVVESLIFRVTPLEEDQPKIEKMYYPVSRALSEVFLEDLKLILGDQRLAETYLATLLNFYFFILVVENCIAVSKRMKGSREEVAELYFALDWEKTTQGRLCYKKGFKTLEPAIEDMFVHAGVLEILNTQEITDEAEQVDYIAIREMLTEFPDIEQDVAAKIRAASTFIQSLGFDNEGVFDSLPQPSGDPVSVQEEIDQLYRIVRKILFETQRDKPRKDYSNSFREFCQGDAGFEKRRGRSGTMLNITEDTLLLLTVISIGHRETISLTELFGQFERRGVFMDELTKEEVARFFEKRSMLDKKSDSGETQYVKRIL